MLRVTKFRAMGCQMMAACSANSNSARIWEKLEGVSTWFEQWEQSLSRFRPESELNKLNRNSGSPQPVSQTLWQVFQAALEAERMSGGLVNPLVLEAVRRAGYTSSFEQMPVLSTQDVFTSLNEAAKLRSIDTVYPDQPDQIVPLLSAVKFDQKTHSLCLPAGVGLDFGGVAKGWAAHQAMRRLQGYGPTLVDAGGDLAISGLQSDGRPWFVDVASPYEEGASLVRLAVGRAGIATSGRDYRRWGVGAPGTRGGSQHHLIDPRRGQPAVTDVLAATVIAPDVLQAETAAKTALILGSQDGLLWLEAQPGLAGLLALENGQQLQSRAFERYVVQQAFVPVTA